MTQPAKKNNSGFTILIIIIIVPVAFLFALYYAIQINYFEKDNLQTHIDSGQCVAKYQSLATHKDKNFYFKEVEGLKNYYIWREGRVIKIGYLEFEELCDYYGYK